MTTYYKAVRPDGTDFHTGTVQWAPPPGHAGEWIVRHPTATAISSSALGYLSVSTAATDCTSMDWPCRLLTVEAVGGVTTPSQSMPNKRAGLAFRVAGELPAIEALGPQGAHAAALIERARHLTADEAGALASMRDATWDVARNAARDIVWAAAKGTARIAAGAAAWYAAWDAVWNAAWNAERNAAGAIARNTAAALVVRDLITTDQYDVLTRTWRTVIGPIHPGDPD